jgi:hypothetical protein
MTIEIHWVFLIPLLTALVAFYITYHSDTEISYLTGAVTVFTLVLSLILAPWELQLLILILIIAWSQKIWFKLETTNISESHKSQKKEVNSLVSEGSTNSSAKEQESSIIGKYRGISWQKPNLPSLSTPLPKANLKYRGNCINNPQNNELKTDNSEKI